MYFKNLKITNIIRACILMIPGMVFAQSRNPGFEKLSTEDGLSNSTVYCICQDSRGYIWIGTNDGLDRYDGYEFKVFNHNYKDSNSVSGDQINSIAEDDSGNLWIGIWDGGLNYFDRSTEKFHSYLDDPSENPITVWKVYVDNKKRIWAGTLGGGLYLFYKRKHSFLKFEHNPEDPTSISDNYISAIYEDGYHNLWIGTENGGLNLFVDKDSTFRNIQHQPGNPNSLASNRINTIFEDRQRNLWIGTVDQGISVLSPDRKRFINYKAENKPGGLNCNNIRSFYQDENNTIWIGSDGGGINFFNYNGNSFTHITNDPSNPSGLSSNVVFSIFKSNDNIVWIGTFQGSLNLYDKKKYKFHPFRGSNSGLSYKTVMSVFEDSRGYIWLGTDGGGLDRFDPLTNSFKYYRHDPLSETSISGNSIKSIFEDPDGDLWIGTHSAGLNLFHRNTGKFIHFKHSNSNPASLSQDDVWDITRDMRGNLWIATLSGGLNLFDRKSGNFKHYRAGSSPTGLSSDNIFSIVADRKRNGLWIGTNDGLDYFDIDKDLIRKYVHDNNNPQSISSNEVNILYLDSRNNLWIGTKKGGLNYYRPETDNFISYTVQDGLISNTISAIIEDNRHFFWISTNRGISKFDPVNKKFTNFSIDDGLQSNEFNVGAAFKRKNGDIIFGGIEGFNIIQPDEVKDNNYIPDVYISKLLISNREVKPGEKGSPLKKVISESKKITLDHNQSVITFEFTALNYTNTEKNKYAYKLENFDKHWNYIGHRRSVTFTNLDPGRYVLKVRGSNNDGVWNEKGTSLEIQILPPWWKTLWFRLSFILTVFTLIFTWFGLRIRAVKKQKLALEQLVLHRTHELAIEKEKVEKQNVELISKQKEILDNNEKITRQRDDIMEMSKKIHQADEEKLKFFTNISHEIRTPLTLILGPIETLRSELTNNHDLFPLISRIHRNAGRLGHLVNQILDFRKIDSKNYPLRASEYDIIKVLKEIIAAFYDMASENKIRISINSSRESLKVWLDYEKFNKIIFNLLSNAFKFTPRGGEISVKVSTSIQGNFDNEINHSGLHFPNGYIEVKIKDSGIGIPPNQLDRIFEKFYRTERSINDNKEGTGIGLTITKELVQLHYGKITATSMEGKGSCFTILLPLGKDHLKSGEIAGINNTNDTPDSIDAQAPEKETTDSDSHPEKPEKILIVEDNYDLRDYLKTCFDTQYKVIEASDGQEGMFKAKTELPAVIISDIMMPGMDGLEMCSMIKNDIEISHIPIILLTARSLHENKLEGLETGADDYISKPFDSKELLLRVKNLIGSRRILREKFSRNLMLQPQEITLTSTDEKFLRKAIEIVDDHMSNPDFDVMQFVKEMSISRTLLHMKLKELTNQSASDFIRTLRLKRAAMFLLQEKVSVAEISYMVGFKDPQYFNRCFKKLFGTTPGNYASHNSVNL